MTLSLMTTKPVPSPPALCPRDRNRNRNRNHNNHKENSATATQPPLKQLKALQAIKAYRQLEIALKKDYFKCVNHEFRTALNSVISLAQLLATDYATENLSAPASHATHPTNAKNQSDMKKGLTIISQTGERILDLIHITQLVMTATSALPIENVQAFSVKNSIDTAIKVLHPYIKSKPITTHVTYAHEKETLRPTAPLTEKKIHMLSAETLFTQTLTFTLVTLCHFLINGSLTVDIKLVEKVVIITFSTHKAEISAAQQVFLSNIHPVRAKLNRHAFYLLSENIKQLKGNCEFISFSPNIKLTLRLPQIYE